MRNCQNGEGCALLPLLREVYGGNIPLFCRNYGTLAAGHEDGTACPVIAYESEIRKLKAKNATEAMAQDTLDCIGE
jgi:hypothetical protein